MHVFGVILCMSCMGLTRNCQGQNYARTKAIFKDKLNPDLYHREIRPLFDQSRVINVSVAFELVSIVEVNDVSQSFSCNGLIWFTWKDELLKWNPADYAGQTIINPEPADIWKPRIALMNTLGERDLFKDDPARVRVVYDGATHWIPGSLFPASCKLDMTKFPFDLQTCYLKMAAIYYSSREMMFFARDSTVGTMFYTVNGEWELIDSKVDTYVQDIRIELLPTIQVTFWLQRRPTFFILNIVLPVVLLSFLNILVFLIPIDSGEKVSYGITVLLALAVFISIVSEMLPQSADAMPLIMLYLVVIFVFSVFTVIDTIVIIFVYHKEEKEDIIRNERGHTWRKDNVIAPYQNTDKNVTISNSNSQNTAKYSQKTPHQSFNDNEKSRSNKYKVIGKFIDRVSFVVFFVIWLALTFGFLLYISYVYRH